MGDVAVRRAASDERPLADGGDDVTRRQWRQRRKPSAPPPPPPQPTQPPLPRSLTTGKTVVVNVSGQRFEVSAAAAATRRLAPGARLAALSVVDCEYDAVRGEHFFARSAAAFAGVLDYYHTGRLHRPGGVCPRAFRDELRFWGLAASPRLAPGRCARCFAGDNGDDDSDGDAEEANDDGGGGKDGSWLTTLDWRQVEAALSYFDCRYPTPSPCSEADYVRYQLWYVVTESELTAEPYRRVAQAWSLAYSLFSVLLFVVVAMSTVRRMQVHVEPQLGGDSGGGGISNGTAAAASLDGYSKLELPSVSRPEPWIGLLFVCCTVYFGAELAVRLALCPVRRRLLLSPTALLDVLLLGSALGVVAIIALSRQHELPAFYWTLKVCQMARVIRFVAYAAQFRGVKVLLLTVRFSVREMLALWALVLLNAMIFATLSYVADLYTEGGVPDMLEGMWWATVTMTTVGYGDVVPSTAPAKLVGGLCALSGLLIVALPIAVIGQNYIRIWERAVAHDAKLARSRATAARRRTGCTVAAATE